MPSASSLSTPVAVDNDIIEGRYADLGAYTLGFESVRQDADPAPLFAGLPDDRCPCPHWGVVVEGQITYRWADHSETFVAGEGYYAPPGHLPLLTAGSSVVEFSPAAELAATMAVLERNLQAAAAAAVTA